MVGILNSPPFYRNIGPNGGQGMLTPYLEQPQQPMPIIPQPQMAAQPTPGAAQAGILDKISNWFQSNPAAIGGLAAGLVGGPSSREALARGFAGWGQGAPQDRKEQRNRAVTEALKSGGAFDKLSPAARAYFEADPDAAAKYLTETLIPKPAEYGFHVVDGKLVRGDKATGSAEMVYDGGAASMRPMSDEEKQAWGIQGGSWALGKDGKPEQIQDDRLLTPEQMAQKKELAVAGSSKVSVDMGGKLTEGQSKDIGFYSRGRNADLELAPLENQLTSLGGAAAGSVGMLGNYAKTPEYQQAERAGREFLAVILRKDTGAAVTPAEFALYGPMYLPVPGDGPEVVADKKRARAGALRAMKLGLGTARPLADQIDSELEDAPPPRVVGTPQQPTTPGKPPAVYEWTPDSGLRPTQ